MHVRCAEAVPNVEAIAVITHDTANGDTLTGIEIGVPLPLLDRNQGGIMRAQDSAAAARRDVDRVILGLQARLAEVFQRHDIGAHQVERYAPRAGSSTVPNRPEADPRRIRSRRIRRAGPVERQRSYFEARLAYLDSLRMLWDAVLEIQGLLLQDSLATPSSLCLRIACRQSPALAAAAGCSASGDATIATCLTMSLMSGESAIVSCCDEVSVCSADW